jgi:FkbM family methyltransferase
VTFAFGGQRSIQLSYGCLRPEAASNRNLRVLPAGVLDPAWAVVSGSMAQIRTPPVAIDEWQRVQMTVGCRDCDSIPKVAGAGQVFHEDGRDIQLMHNGLRVVAGGYNGAWMQTIIEQLRGHHEPQEELIFDALMGHMGPEATMLELGGYWCYYSLWFLKDAPGRRSWAIEPNPEYLKVGSQNADLNSAQGLSFGQACIGPVSIPRVRFQTETAGVVDIPQITVPDLMRRLSLETLDLLHCDTQGAETGVIESCEALFRRRQVRFAMISTHAHQISGDPLTHQRCLQMVRDYGGQILAEHDVHESFSGDGLITAWFGEGSLDWTEPPMSRNRYSTSYYRNPLYDLAERG